MEDGPWFLLRVLYLLCSLTWPVAVGEQISDTQVTPKYPGLQATSPTTASAGGSAAVSSPTVLSLHLFPDSSSNLAPLLLP